MWRSMAALVRPYQREALAGRLRVVGSQAGSSTLAWSSLAPQFLGFFRKSSHDCNVGQSAVRAGPSCAESSLFGKRYTHLHTKSTAPCRSLFRSNYFQVRSISSTPTTNGNAPSWLFSKSQPAPKSSPETDRKPESVQRRPPSKVDDAPEEVSSVASRDNWNRTPADLRQSSNAETDADRRQRSLEQTASTSSSPAASASAARKPTVQHPTPKYSSTVPQPASPATPNTGSQYAQKASTQQRSRLGNKPIRDLLQSKSITLPDYSPGQKRTQCPMCAGGTSHEESLALHISEDSQSAKWICHRATCGWEGGIDQGSGSVLSPDPCYLTLLLSVVVRTQRPKAF